ncbi:MAG: BatA domain-containing protein [Pirellulales bacterium]
MFLFPTLLWIGLPLIAVPLLIHLINMLRHRRVRWAAMDFLLQSQRKHRRWIMLKQLLLLMARMGAVAVIVLMLSQPVLRSEWGELLGGAKTHQVVLLDDSFSMSDRWPNTSAFDQAKAVVGRLAEMSSEQGGARAFSLLRFSQAARMTAGSQPDLVQETVDSGFQVRLEKLLGPMQPSQTAASPMEAITALRRLPTKAGDENRIVYIVSDFRSREWDDVTDLRKLLEELRETGAELHLVQCVDEARPNLAIASLAPSGGTQSAGVEMLMELAITNYGDVAAKQVAVQLQEDGYPRPAVVVDQIEPRETVKRVFRLNFTTAGPHTVAATLPSDAVRTDNVRYWAIDLPDAIGVLLIDGSREARDAYFLASALAPGGKVQTGLRTQIESPRFLRQHDRLSDYSAIYLSNVDRLDPPEIDALEEYVRNGGGVAFFLGELSRGPFITEQLYREGEGLFPAPVTISTELLVDRLEQSPDLVVTQHPMFSVFASERNSFINMVKVSRYFAVADGWQPEPRSGTRVIARLRNGAPLAMEKKFGDGKVVALLSKASPEPTQLGSWNNWGRNNPSFVVAMLELQNYLASTGSYESHYEVGQQASIELDPQEYQPEVRLATPPEGPGELMVDAVAESEKLVAALPELSAGGFYEATLTTKEGRQEHRVLACNVIAAEGDLELIDRAGIRSRLDGIDHMYHRAEDLQFDPQQLAGFNLSDSLLYALLALLIGEQILAYSASYHPSSAKGGPR